MFYFNPGELRQSITLQTLQEIPNAAGEIGQQPRNYATVKAKVEPVKPLTERGGEFMENRKEFPQLTYQITLRYRSDITTDMIVVLGARKFQIIGWRDPEERHIAVILDCIEKVKP